MVVDFHRFGAIPTPGLRLGLPRCEDNGDIASGGCGCCD